MWAVIGIIFIAGFILHYLTSAIKETHFYCGSSVFGRFLAPRCTVLQERYWPNPFIANAHLMTRFCTIFRSKLEKLTFCREIIPTPDKGQISIDWYAPDRSSPSAQEFTASDVGQRPVALFLPGIAGTSAAEYLRTLVPLAYGIGYQPVVLNYRGLTSTPLLNSRLYCALNFEDLETVLKHIKAAARCEPDDVKIIATALSMGGTILAGYLTSRGSSSLIDGAFMASVVWDAAAGARRLESGFWNRDINKMMTKSLIKVVQRHRSWFEDDPKYDLKAVECCKALRAFDEAFTRRMFGFASADDYYAACTYNDKMHLIKVPTLVLQAADDMMANEKDLPTVQVTKSSHVAMVVTPKGGHLGFMDAAKSNGQSTYYLERLFVQYLAALYNVEGSPREIISSQASS